MNNFFKHDSAILEDNVTVGENTRIWVNSQIRSNACIGSNCNIGKDTFIDSGVTIGDNVKIQNGVSVYHGVTIEDNVFIGPNAVFTNDLFPRALGEWEVSSTLIKMGASIGANSTIVCGHTVGKYAMVGAGSVVTTDIPDNALVVGNPAKVIGFVCECGRKLDAHGFCAHCGKEYIFE